MSKKTYEHQQIVKILAEAEKEGDKAVRARYGLSNATLGVWRNKVARGNSQVQVVSKATKAKVDPEHQKLLEENMKLRTKLAEKLLEEYLQD